VVDAGRIHVLTGADDVRRAVTELATLPVLGLDTETTGLDPRSHRVRLVQIAAPDGRVYVVDLFAVLRSNRRPGAGRP
jgi:DNA polymerase-1